MTGEFAIKPRTSTRGEIGRIPQNKREYHINRLVKWRRIRWIDPWQRRNLAREEPRRSETGSQRQDRNKLWFLFPHVIAVDVQTTETRHSSQTGGIERQVSHDKPTTNMVYYRTTVAPLKIYLQGVYTCTPVCIVYTPLSHMHPKRTAYRYAEFKHVWNLHLCVVMCVTPRYARVNTCT